MKKMIVITALVVSSSSFIMTTPHSLKEAIQEGDLKLVREIVGTMGKMTAAQKAEYLEQARLKVKDNSTISLSLLDLVQIIGGGCLLGINIHKLSNECWKLSNTHKPTPEYMKTLGDKADDFNQKPELRLFLREIAKKQIFFSSLGAAVGALLMANGAYCRGARTRMKAAKKIQAKIVEATVA